VRIGCAGWSIPRGSARYFPGSGSHLERYAARLDAVEINSSFYRAHRPATYERWAAAVPSGFRFSVKLVRELTHDARLTETDGLRDFFDRVGALGSRLGVVLVQLPPSLAFDARRAQRFFAALRNRYPGGVACEPRHATWFTPRADALLRDAEIARVAADPPCVPAAALPGGWPGLVYHRLHGSPRTYWSAYSESYLEALVTRLERTAPSAETWCVFDNTAAGAAVENALHVARVLGALAKKRARRSEA
jgi:uncharacterized protein YecE (DUF72 family)